MSNNFTPSCISVNGQIIPNEAITFEAQRLKAFFRGHMTEEALKEQESELMRKAVEQAIGAKLLMTEAGRLDLKVPAEEVERRLQDFMKKAGGEQAFMKQLASQNIELDTVRDGIQHGGKVDVLIAQVTADAEEPTEKDVLEYFESHREDFRRPARASAQHILKTLEADDDKNQKEILRARLHEMKQQVSDGADFGDLAQAHSDCPSGKKAQGSLGWFNQGAILPVLDEAVFGMDIDEVSDVLESPLGLHLVRKTGYEEGGAAEFDDVRENVRDLLRHIRRGELLREYVEELKTKADVQGVDEYLRNV